MFTPGAIIVVTEKPDVTYVTVNKTIGPIKGTGWLVYTEERNYILVDTTGDHAYLTRIVFLTDHDSIKRYIGEAINNV